MLLLEVWAASCLSFCWFRAVAGESTVIEELDFYDPITLNGSWYTIVENTFPPGLGEPLNVVVSAESDPDVLSETMFKDWLRSVGFAEECAGLHLGSLQSANLGDGNGIKTQAGISRWSYGIYSLGTCLESLDGGNHVRYWFQDGLAAPSNAIFLAVSAELNSTLGHDIIPNGYDLGRTWFLGNATKAGGITTSPATGIVFNVTVNMTQGYLKVGSQGINHGVAIDGYLAVVKITLVDISATVLSVWDFLILVLFVLSSILGGYAILLCCHPDHTGYELLDQERIDKNLNRSRSKHVMLLQLNASQHDIATERN